MQQVPCTAESPTSFLKRGNAQKLGNVLWKRGDGQVIDGLGPDGVALVSQKISGLLSKFQTGFVFQYAFMMMIGVIAIVTWVAYAMGLFDMLGLTN